MKEGEDGVLIEEKKLKVSEAYEVLKREPNMGVEQSVFLWGGSSVDKSIITERTVYRLELWMNTRASYW